MVHPPLLLTGRLTSDTTNYPTADPSAWTFLRYRSTLGYAASATHTASCDHKGCNYTDHTDGPACLTAGSTAHPTTKPPTRQTARPSDNPTPPTSTPPTSTAEGQLDASHVVAPTDGQPD